jgi:signal transduction protein with GAF and PtsI domain
MPVSTDIKVKEQHFSNMLFLTKKLIVKIQCERSRSKLLKYVAENVSKIFDADGSAIYLYNSQLNELTLDTVHNLRPNLVGLRIKADQGLLGKVVKNKKAMKIDDYRVWPERAKVFEKDQYRALLEAPIIWKDNLFGLIGLVRTGNSEPFSDFDLHLNSILAIQVGALLASLEFNDS